MEHFVHDPIHGEIQLSDLAVQIIDHPYFERLHYILQLGTAYRLFPSATHTRKSHSIGTYGLTKKLLKNLSYNYDIDEKTQELICIGALCHDIGHCTGSHLFDKHIIPKMVESKKISEDHPWIRHEKRSVDIFKEIAESMTLKREDIDFICNVIDPPSNSERWEFTIVNNKVHGIDTDKLDYILRDNYIIGLKLNIDINKILTQSRIIQNKWAFSERIHDELYNIYFVRYRLYRYIYNHSKVVSFDMMFRDIILYSTDIFEGLVDCFKTKKIKNLCKYTDSFILNNGSFISIERFQRRNTYSLSDSSYKHNVSHEEVVPLKINIQNSSINSIPIYEAFSFKLKFLDPSILWGLLPTEEKFQYKFNVL
tara:strand:+ start:1468 stop:2568 length:1101 start_codon:yes stop_codon:yes gene_type:complete